MVLFYIKKSKRCKLLIYCDPDEPTVVAQGTIMANTSHAPSHCEEIKEGYIRVSVDKVIRDYMGYPLPVSTTYVKILDHAVGSFVQWPKKTSLLFIILDNRFLIL